MPQQRKNKGGRLPLVIENARVDLAIQAMRLNPGNAYRAATWLKEQVGCPRRTSVNLLARARERIVAACQADMSSAFGELYADVREAMAKCRPQAKTETEAEFMPFQVYRMRVFDGMPGKEVAVQLGVSEPTVSRYLQRIRDLLRRRLAETIATYSFTAEEQEEARRAGLGDDDVMFDDGLRDIYYKQSQLLMQDETAASEVF